MTRIGHTLSSALLAAALPLIAVVAFSAPATASAAGCDRADSNAEQLSSGQARDAIHCLVNKERTQRGLSRLDRDKKLQRAAQRHNDRMHGTGCFAHACPGEAELDRRLDGVGYLDSGLTRWAFGENIAWGTGDSGTPRAIVGAWMNSPGHRVNILSSSFREIGVGFSLGTPRSKNDLGGIYTTDFGLAVR